MIVRYRCPSAMSVSLIYIRRSTPLTILRLPKPISECTYVPAFSSFASTIDSWVLTPESTNYVIKVLWSYCDTIAIGDTSYRYELIRSQLSTNRFVSPRASESALSYTHRVCIGLMIAANDWTLNLTTLYWSQIYSNLQLSCFAIYRTESIPHPLRTYESQVLFAQNKKVCSKWGLIGISPFSRLGPDIWIICFRLISYITLHISRCHNALILTTPHLPRNKPLEREWIVIWSATMNKVSRQ